MRQHVTEHHNSDVNGNPAGGVTTGTGILINWQDGPLAIEATADHPAHRRDPNGAFVEGVLEAALGRLEYYQTSRFKCRENALAITKIEEALHWLQHRTADREHRGVEGTHNK